MQVKIMQSIDGPHNIVRLLATCTDTQPLYMIMEFASRGDLKGVLKHARPRVGG
jgi:serine/threonine protein kinase